MVLTESILCPLKCTQMNSQNSSEKQAICLLFRVHQPYRLKPYRFFDIGKDHSYFNQILNSDTLRKVSWESYLPVNDVLMKLIRKFGNGFKIALSISGTAIEQMKRYVPEALESFRELYKTGNVELVAESYSNSLALVTDKAEYKRQVDKQVKLLHCFFSCKPSALINSHFLFSNELADLASGMGFKVILADEVKKLTGRLDYNHSQENNSYPEIKIALRNNDLSDDISSRFSSREWAEWPLTPKKYLGWLDGLEQSPSPVNLFIDYATFADKKNLSTGILIFLQNFASKVVSSKRWHFKTVSEAAETVLTVIKSESPASDESRSVERILASWIGNDLQQEALYSLYSALPIMASCNDNALRSDWYKLQSSDHFYYMSFEKSHDGKINRTFNPYDSPYDAFINYMNVMSDFLLRVNNYGYKHLPANQNCL